MKLESCYNMRLSRSIMVLQSEPILLDGFSHIIIDDDLFSGNNQILKFGILLHQIVLAFTKNKAQQARR